MKTELFLLAAQAGQYDNMTFAERAAESLKVAALGLGTVFAVLAILWGVLEIFRYVFYDIPRKRRGEKAEEESGAPAPKEQDEPIKPADDGEIVAAITAAVAAVMEKNTGSFRVVSFRRSGTR